MVFVEQWNGYIGIAERQLSDVVRLKYPCLPHRYYQFHIKLTFAPLYLQCVVVCIEQM